MAPGIVADIGSVQGWLHDPARQFLRASEAADRASALRRRIREVRRARGPLREATPEEAAELRGAGRERARAEALRARIERVIAHVARLDPADRMTIEAGPSPMTSRRLDAIEREIARHAVQIPGPPIRNGAHMIDARATPAKTLASGPGPLECPTTVAICPDASTGQLPFKRSPFMMCTPNVFSCPFYGVTP